MKKRFHFTLIELLVVIAIIAILAGILLPALSKVKVRAKSADCTSQFKQVTTAFLSYTTSSNDSFAPLQYGAADNMNSIFWINMIPELGAKRTPPEKFFDKKEKHLLACPASIIRPTSRGNWDGITTGYNQTWAADKPDGLFKKLSSIKKPSLHLTFVDTWKDESTDEGRHLGRYRLPGNKYIAFRHAKKSTAAYLDGHVALEDQRWLRLNSIYYYPLNRSTTDRINNGDPRPDANADPIVNFAPF